MLIVAGIVNTFAETLLTALCYISVAWQIIGTLVIVIWMLIASPELQPASFVFTTYNNQSGFDSGVYVTLIGCLAAASIFTGYDTAAHVAEETTAAHNSVPLGMIYSVINALVLGLVLIIGMNFCIPQNGGIAAITQGDDDNPQSYATLWDITVGREATVVFLLITLVAIECSNCANLTSAARMLYSFARYVIDVL